MPTFYTETHEKRFNDYMSRGKFDFTDTWGKAFVYVISCDLLANKLSYIYDLENKVNLMDESKLEVLSSSERQMIKVASDLYGCGLSDLPTLGALLSNFDTPNVFVLKGVIDIFLERL